MVELIVTIFVTIAVVLILATSKRGGYLPLIRNLLALFFSVSIPIYVYGGIAVLVMLGLWVIAMEYDNYQRKLQWDKVPTKYDTK